MSSQAFLRISSTLSWTYFKSIPQPSLPNCILFLFFRFLDLYHFWHFWWTPYCTTELPRLLSGELKNSVQKLKELHRGLSGAIF